ncbi:site-specific integrase [Senegalia massiliensis]|uniref:Site-specific integrase n=2 Tax=Senegalia massiliensis TaxID=1720316 RepID=A0A845QXB8_9CLOT|nr:tyrosine-type recombinase/integrase [Senegalia massiliensis]NBI06634.1 site-specific integrase [Senegalia massiliensis]
MLYCTSKNLSSKTIKAYEQTVKLFLRYLYHEHNIDEIEEVKTSHIRNYVKYLQERGKYTDTIKIKNNKYINNPENRNDYGKQISETTINNYLRNIKVFFSFLQEERIIRVNPCNRIKYLKTKRKMKETISQEEFRTLLRGFDLTKYTGYRDYIITIILLDTGMRIGECLSLTTEDIDIKNKVILISKNVKGNKERYVYLSFKMASELRKWINYKDRYIESYLLFPTNRNTFLKVGNFEKNLKKVGNSVGISIHPHQLRNQFAKQYLLNGGDLYTLSRILGHSSVKITEQAYLDLTTEDIKKKYCRHSPLSKWNIIS